MLQLITRRIKRLLGIGVISKRINVLSSKWEDPIKALSPSYLTIDVLIYWRGTAYPTMFINIQSGFIFYARRKVENFKILY